MNRLRKRRWQRILWSAFVLAAPARAAAGEFDASGTFTFAPGALVGVTPATLANVAAGYQKTNVTDGLTGGAVLTLSSNVAYASLPLPLAPPVAAGEYSARVWVRHGDVDVRFVGQNAGGTPFVVTAGPTGRVTSDGWVELASNPFALGPVLTSFSFAANGHGQVDAIEVDAVGAAVAEPTCGGVSDPTCTGDRICLQGVCVDPNRFVPPPPPPAARAEAVAYLHSRVQHLFGGVATRALYLNAALSKIDALADAASGWAFWNGWVTALHALHDWHTQTEGPVAGVKTVKRVQACFTDGVADRSQTAAPSDPSLPDVLVSSVGTSGALGLRAGDRLVAVDGVHPVAWALGLAGVDWGYRQASDAAAGYSDFTERLYDLIAQFAGRISIVRCDGASGACDAAPTEVARAQFPDDDGSLTLTCDHRPAYHTADLATAKDPSGKPVSLTHDIGTNVFGGVVDESGPGENIFGMTWDYVYSADDGVAGQQMQKAVAAQQAAWASSARGVVLDHRSGGGGTLEGASFVTRPLVPAALIAVSPIFMQISDTGGPVGSRAGLAFFAEFKAFDTAAFDVGGGKVDPSLPVAFLVQRDVSASDYLALALKKGAASGANVKIFGPHPTSGSFSSLFELTYWGGINWYLASGDTVTPDGATHAGTGVTPDTIVAAKQSDLMNGKDTVYETALAWVRAGLK